MPLRPDVPQTDSGKTEHADPRIATSVTLSGMLACLLLATVASIGMTPSNVAAARDGKGPSMPSMTAVGPAPAFCKNQTWPDVDVRCLNRTAPSPEPSVAVAPAVAPAPSVAPQPSAADAPIRAASAVTPEAPPAVADEQDQEPSTAVEADAPEISSFDEEPIRRPYPRQRHRYERWNSPTSRSSW